MGVEYTALADGQPATVAFPVLAWPCGQRGTVTGMGAIIYTEIIKGGENTPWERKWEINGQCYKR